VEEAGVDLHTEIKAATYSGLEIEEGKDGVLSAEVIFDV
jgi:SHS2 domain-containing protein